MTYQIIPESIPKAFIFFGISLILNSLSKIVLNHERDNIANKKCKKASIIIQNLYIIYKQKPCIELSLYTWLFFTYSFLIGSYSSLFWFQIKHYMFLYFIIPSFQNKRNIYREHQIRKMSTTAISRSVIEMLQGIETAILHPEIFVILGRTHNACLNDIPPSPSRTDQTRLVVVHKA